MSLLIDAHEERDTACADVAGAYLNADMDRFTAMKLTGESVDIMCTVNPEYLKYVTVEKGRKVLYLRLLKALYGCVQSALLWYNLFSGTLVKMGFVLNKYDPCVANKMINGKQCTVAWYVEDNKISHADPDVVTSVINKIEERFGKMVVTRGDTHVFLGMEVFFPGDRTVKIRMKDHLQECITTIGNVAKSASSCAKRGLFEIDETSPPLSEERSDTFHSVVAKMLYVTHRPRIDLQLPIGFLCTRVSKSTEQDWVKLKRALAFANGTLNDWRVLRADDLAVMRTWVDASYAVHPDLKSHTGGGVSFGRGTLMAKSTKQKLNTKSSTEAELVGASDYLPNSVWLRMFLEEQGYVIKENIFYQDNQSAMKLEINGRRSAGPKSRHIDIRHFFVNDRIKTENLKVTYCPTEAMLADYFTKPLQGALFRRLRAVVMGHLPISALFADNMMEPHHSNQERVGNNDCVTWPKVKRTIDERVTESQGNDAKRSYAEVVRGKQQK